MSFYVVVNKQTGEALSYTTVLSPEMLPRVSAIEIPHFPRGGERWDANLRRLTNRKERLAARLAARFNRPIADVLVVLEAEWVAADIGLTEDEGGGV